MSNFTNMGELDSSALENVASIAVATTAQHQLIRTIFSSAELADIDERANIRSYQIPLLYSLGLDDCEVMGLYECPSPTGNPKSEKLLYNIATQEWIDHGEEDAHGIGMNSLMSHICSYTEMEAANVLKDFIDGYFNNTWPSHQQITSVAPAYDQTNLNTLFGIDKLPNDLDESVIFTNGEASADVINSNTCFFGVSLRSDADISKVDFTPLRGRIVYLWADNNDAGSKQLAKVSASLYRQDRKAAIFKLKPLMYLPKYLHEGATLDTLKDNESICDLKLRLEPLPIDYNAADAFTDGWTSEKFNDVFFEHVQIVNFAFEIQKVGSFIVKEDGVYEVKSNKDGEEYETKISSSIEVTALTRDAHNKNWGLLLVFYDRDGVKHEWAMPKELLASKNELCQILLSRGADVLPTEHNKLPEYLMEAKPKARARCVSSPGWHDGLFVTTAKSYGTSDERVLFQTANARKASPFGVSGTLQEWQAHIGSKCVGNSRIILGACLALTGPFIESLKLENGGVNLRGESSTGKTKSATVAGSIWGGKAMVNTWKATGNALESIARAHNDAVLILDELGQVDPREAGDVAYMLGNGQGKARANVNGDAKDSASWRVLFLSTGEISLADQITAGGGRVRAGQEVRMLDIPSDAGAGMGAFENIHGANNPKEFADSLQHLSETYYGTPADALLTRITQAGELAKAVEFIQQKQAQFVREYVPVNAHGQVSRAASRFGAIAGVGEYCASIGILPWEPGNAAWGVLKCYTAWLESRGDNTASEDIRALAQVRGYIERNGESRFTIMQVGFDDNVGQRTINRAGFRKVQGDGSTEYWILPEMFKAEVCEGFDPKLVIRVLKDHGYLELDSAGKSSVSKLVPGMGRMRVYVIKASLMQSAD